MKRERLLVTCFVFLGLLVGCNSHAYYNEAQQYLAAVEAVLIEHGVCNDKTDCSQKQIAFFASGGWKIGPYKGGGVTITVHKVIDTAIARRVIESCRKLHTQIPEVPVSITVFSNPHIDNLHPGTPHVVLSEEIS